jgi:hypothetical protein
MRSMPLCLSLLLAGASGLGAFGDLSPDQIKLLKDPNGWDYSKMTDSGMRTEHACFDGKPHPDLCSGRLTLSTNGKFEQTVTIQGQAVPRHGTYTLEDDQLAFLDELETRDGPYTIEIDVQQKTLVMYTAAVRVELVLHKALLDKKPGEKKRKETK